MSAAPRRAGHWLLVAVAVAAPINVALVVTVPGFRHGALALIGLAAAVGFWLAIVVQARNPR
ncbi:MAG TPA: hypothetical protein VF825_12725 [Oryzihumus sp.]